MTHEGVSPAAPAVVSVPRAAFCDARLSLKARGLLALCLALADDGRVSTGDLQRHAPGASSAGAVEELVTFGYLRRSNRNLAGATPGLVYTVSATGSLAPAKSARGDRSVALLADQAVQGYQL